MLTHKPYVMNIPKRRRDTVFKNSLAKLFPSSSLSENQLYDCYTRLCNFPILIKDYLCHELDWTETDFSQRVLPPHVNRNIGPNEREIFIIRAVLKSRLQMFLQYLETPIDQALTVEQQ